MRATPHLTVNDGLKAIEFYTAALGATVVRTMLSEDKAKVMFAEFALPGGGQFYMNDDFPEYCGGVSRVPKGLSPVTMHIDEMPSCDEALATFAKAGGTITMPAQDMFWGDRYGQATDPYGHSWAFSHPLKG